MSPQSESGLPDEVARATETSEPGDAADQADRLTMIMEAEAVRNGLAGSSGEGGLDGYDRPLKDVEALLVDDGADDASDDPLHASGLTGPPVIEAELAAMHVVDDVDPSRDFYLADEDDEQRADPDFDQFAEPLTHLTPEDETLMGVDPYE